MGLCLCLCVRENILICIVYVNTLLIKQWPAHVRFITVTLSGNLPPFAWLMSLRALMMVWEKSDWCVTGHLFKDCMFCVFCIETSFIPAYDCDTFMCYHSISCHYWSLVILNLNDWSLLASPKWKWAKCIYLKWHFKKFFHGCFDNLHFFLSLFQ